MGHDADASMARGEVGKVGVSISSLRDMETLFDGIPLDQVSTSMTINAPAALLLLLYELVAEKQGVPGHSLNGTVQNDILKEFAARRLWASIVKERFKTGDARAQMLRFHTQTGGSTLTAQQPHNNVVRVALQSLSAVLGGTQSLHANSFDEALGLPSQEAATLSVRTQQIIAHETNVASVADPLGGSYLVEALTREIEMGARAQISEVDRRGGAIPAIETGFTQDAIQESAYRFQQAVESGRRVVVGVNRFQSDHEAVEIVKISPKHEREQAEALKRLRQQRNAGEVEARLADVRPAAEGDSKLLPPMREALRRYATIGEVCAVLRDVFGEYRPGTRS